MLHKFIKFVQQVQMIFNGKNQVLYPVKEESSKHLYEI